MEKNKNKCSILNIGAGKINDYIEYLDYTKDKNCFLVNVDRGYFENQHPNYIETTHSMWLLNKLENITKYINIDIFEFLERYKYKFDTIIMYRFFEHIQRDRLLYFIYLLSTIVKISGIVDIISPNYYELAQRMLDENVYDKDFDKHDILISTEMFNEKSDPHQNITTPARVEKLFEYENRFKVKEVFNPYLFDGRKIYFRSLMKRI